jgi:iron complex outermembrane receptor protein
VVDDRLLVRFAAQAQKRDGFTVDRGPIFPGKDYDNRDYWSARLSVVWRPIENVENYTIFSDFRSNEHGDGFVLSAVNPAGPFATSLLPILAQQQAAGVRNRQALQLRNSQYDTMVNKRLRPIQEYLQLPSAKMA